jgi:phosphopantetheine--protein transferase-like protein
MPLFYQHDINRDTKVGVWQIEEPELHFLAYVPMKTGVFHPRKRLQHLAGRYLLKVLFADFPLEEIRIADTNKPFLENEKYHFSISHCADYAAAMVSRTNRVGVDIEMVNSRIEQIHHKFLSPQEYRFVADQWREVAPVTSSAQNSHSMMLTSMWSAKEALFKWYGLGQVDFSKHLQLDGPIKKGLKDALTYPFVFKKNNPLKLEVQIIFFDHLVLAWVME